METSPVKESSDLTFLLDKKRKLETSFKIPKKKRVEEEPRAEDLKPTPLSPVRADEPRKENKAPKVKKKKVPTVLDLEKDEAQSPPREKPKLTLLETPKMPALLETPQPMATTPDSEQQPITPPLTDEDQDNHTQSFMLPIPKSEIVQEHVTLDDGTKHPLTRSVWLQVFSQLSHGNLAQCMGVSKVWHEWISDPSFWKSVNLSRYGPIFPDTLKSVVQRQPCEIDLSYCTISRKQTDWLLPRLQGLQSIRMSGLPTNIISSLHGLFVPNLRYIDVRWVDELNDWALRDLLCATSGKEVRPRFPDLKGLQLSGCPISEDAIKNIVQYTPVLEYLDMSYNNSINDRVVDTLCASSLIYSLKKLDFSGCIHITDKSLLQLKKCYDLQWLDFRSCREITRGACVRFTASSKRELVITEDKLIHPPHVQIYNI